MNANNFENNEKKFVTPIVIAMYSVFTMQLGDTQNKKQFYLPLVKNFYR